MLQNAKVVSDGTQRPVEEMAAEVLYRGPKGEFGFPRKNLRTCLILAGYRVALGGAPISTTNATRITEFLTIEDDFICFTDLADPPWVVDVRRGRSVVAKSRARIGIVRPRFDQWGFKATLQVDFDVEGVTEDLIRTLVRRGGTWIGLGGYRIQSGGPFGRFVVTGWEIV